jgi:chaperonin cofactor prefoldin
MYVTDPAAFVVMYTVIFVSGYIMNSCSKDRIAQQLEREIEYLEEKVEQLEERNEQLEEKIENLTTQIE